MKKHWLRRMLLGLSLALLLSGGVALARGLFFTVDKECVECWPGEGAPTQDRYLLGFTVGGWDAGYALCWRMTIDGELYAEDCEEELPPEGSYSGTMAFPCEWRNNLRPGSVLGVVVNVSNGPPGPLGEWVERVWQEIPDAPDPSAEASWRVAQICEPEFVPEPGTVLLLGSGLMGLAGYAGLRWRSRER